MSRIQNSPIWGAMRPCFGMLLSILAFALCAAACANPAPQERQEPAAVNSQPTSALSEPQSPLPAPPAPPTPSTDEEVVQTESSLIIQEFGSASLDERIFRSDVIAIATMKSASASARSHVDSGYVAALEFTFDVHEYLKGEGGESLIVELRLGYWSPRADVIRQDSFRGVYQTEDAAVEAGNKWIAQDRWWDDRASILFLQSRVTPLDETAPQNAQANGAPRHSFFYAVPGNEGLIFPTAIDSSNGDDFSIESKRTRSWLPSSSPEMIGDALPSSLNNGEMRFLLGETPGTDAYSGGAQTPGATNAIPDAASATATSEKANAQTPGSVSLSELRSRIDAMDDLLEKGEGIEGYERCMEYRFLYERQPYTPHREEHAMESGLPAGSAFWSGWNSIGLDDLIDYFKGPDKHLFKDEMVDSNDDPVDGYGLDSRSRRPLPRGNYELEYYMSHADLLPCGYEVIDSYWTIIATAPAGTLHEAFFDPASIGNGGAVGADASSGVLKPAGFTFGGAGVSLDSIRWESQAAEMRLSPHTTLANHHADFIALDGSVALRLDFDDATETGEGDSRALSWAVCAQPWQPGDLLMLRISESPADLTGVSRDGDCVSPTATAESDTPTPAPGG